MCNEDFYAEFGDELLTFNGLDYSVNNHSPGARYMATGKLDSLAYPTFAALVAACRGPDCPLAFLTFGNYSATGNLVAMSRVPYLPSLQKIANADAVEGNERSPVPRRVRARPHRAGAAASRTKRARPQPRLPRPERGENMLYAAQVNSKALQRVTQYIPATIPKERLSQQAEIALASFKAGVCVSANLTIGQFDSHANNDPDQMKLIPEFLAGIAYLLRRAEELKIREQARRRRAERDGPHARPTTTATARTTGRSARSCSSGRGIKGNRVIGATDEKQFAVPLDPQIAEAATRRRASACGPSTSTKSLREFAGIADHPLSKKFPLGVPEKERLQGFWG